MRRSGQFWAVLGLPATGDPVLSVSDQKEPTVMYAKTSPSRTEAADYYFTYIDKVEPGDICDTLEAQLAETMALFGKISDDQSLTSYAPGKWTIREVVSHINDTERLFVFRAFWFARGLEAPLPSFEQDIAVAHAGAAGRSWRSHLDEFAAIRAATLAFFRSLPEDAWMRHGVASGYPFTVRALAYITAGHVAHHLKILREQYLVAAAS
jgi:hypothetical protein